ncbi:MAG: hypothetical protein IJL53_08620 [Firmicutes bacterium]|nr:hypothetical protein [Bacillota bacterium]
MRMPDAGKLDEYFPASAFIRPTLFRSLLISLGIYIIGAIVVHLILGIFIPFGVIGVIARIIRWLADAYVTIGIIYSILKYLQVIKK